MHNKRVIYILGILFAASVFAGLSSPDNLRSFKPVKENVKIYGRTVTDNGSLWLGLSATGIGFTFKGSKVEIDVHGDDAPLTGQEGERLVLFVDGERRQDVMLDDSPVQTIKEDMKNGTHTVRLIKASECTAGTAKVDEIRIDSDLIYPERKRAHTIEFIGDSITCGYAIDSVNEDDGFKVSQEDATKSYAYRTALNFDADPYFVCYSGCGIISGYTSDPKKPNTDNLMGSFYEKTGHCFAKMDGKRIDKVRWDFAAEPELIVINLGTNDNFYIDGDKKKEEEYKRGYVRFLKDVRRINPDSHILVASGFYGRELYELTAEAVEDFVKETGDKMTDSCLIRPVDKEKDGVAGDGHPTKLSHDRAVPGLTKEISRFMGWKYF